jgi:hypothetical protein
MEGLSHWVLRLLYNIPNVSRGKVNFVQTGVGTFFYFSAHRFMGCRGFGKSNRFGLSICRNPHAFGSNKVIRSDMENNPLLFIHGSSLF